MKERRAVAEIVVNPSKGWTLPTFGSKKPFRYWAHVHFEKDPTWGERTWTLLVDLDKAPGPITGNVEATVYFMSPQGPEHLLEAGAKFNCCVGKVITPKG